MYHFILLEHQAVVLFSRGGGGVKTLISFLSLSLSLCHRLSASNSQFFAEQMERGRCARACASCMHMSLHIYAHFVLVQVCVRFRKQPFCGTVCGSCECATYEGNQGGGGGCRNPAIRKIVPRAQRCVWGQRKGSLGGGGGNPRGSYKSGPSAPLRGGGKLKEGGEGQRSGGRGVHERERESERASSQQLPPPPRAHTHSRAFTRKEAAFC